jgi:Tfp pilus assembly protein FimV
VLAQQGWGAWPACSRKLGLKGKPAPFKAAPQATPAAPKKVTSTAGGKAVEVKPGDTLAKIAAANGIDGWKQLHALNPDLANPNVLSVGDMIRLA